MNVEQRTMTQPERYLNSKIISTIVKSMDKEFMSADSRISQIAYLKNKCIHQGKVIPTIGITIHGTIVTILEHMDIF